MNTITTVIVLIYYIVSIFNMIYLYGRYKVCPELLWCASQLLMFFGITHFINSNYSSDSLLLWLYLLALICFMVSSSLTRIMSHPRKIILIEKRPDNYQKRKIYIWVMMTVSILLCGMFFVRGGGNVFINGVRSLLNGNEYLIKYSRMGFLSIAGVGYIYQLRVIILPLLVLYYIIIKRIKPISVILAIIMVAFLVGTGQRGGFFSFVIIVMISVYYFYGKKEDEDSYQKRPKKLVVYGVVLGIAGLLLGLSTILNGRVAEGGSAFSAIVKRVIEDNQSCAVWGFRYITSQPIQNGKDWLLQLIDILPGQNSYMSLDTRIFAYMHGGSTDGTSPACIWGSAYYNFGIIGVILLSSVLGVAITKLHSNYSKSTNDEFGIIIYSAEQFLLAYWVAAGPIVLFNSGFVSVVLLNIIMMIALKYPIVIHRR